MFKLISKTLAAVAMVSVALFGSANAKTLKIETHFTASSPNGEVAAQFAKNVEKFSGGSLKIEMFYSSSVTGKSAEVFNSAQTGIIDCDMTGAGYQTGKNAAFQFAGDVMGGYDNPYQQYEFLNYPGAQDAVDALYNKYGMTLIGWWIPGHESLISSRPIPDVASLKDFKFRSPPGMESMIFTTLGAKPIVMDFGEVPTALQTGLIDGADYSSLATNYAGGHYEQNKYATYPGFHSMPADHLACNTKVWNKLKPHEQGAMKAGIEIAGRTITSLVERKNAEAVKALNEMGVTLHDWSREDRLKFRTAALAAWEEWKTKSPEAAALIEIHKAYMKANGIM
ncbi:MULTISPECIES: TRAP transporter substrate-binding protein DctP [Candidatus Pelagibacter]|jgi:TRAP-type C4-dicarboxylate transport system substrate-binding protein|uniref:TRAP transporter substrate-binding protein DctP n=1 Tax=Candidatus Pelagibacter TaxID=198251 RepID=UPI00065B3C22|nr:TRAP transporter substrate-binding protein DctP [Candidatus Pelagibacter ubique]